jgi:hypothetical protein
MTEDRDEIGFKSSATRVGPCPTGESRGRRDKETEMPVIPTPSRLESIHGVCNHKIADTNKLTSHPMCNLVCTTHSSLGVNVNNHFLSAKPGQGSGPPTLNATWTSVSDFSAGVNEWMEWNGTTRPPRRTATRAALYCTALFVNLKRKTAERMPAHRGCVRL